VFGLTGGIGSGKSTVSRRYRERGLPVVDADELAREAVVPGSATLASIVARFGHAVLDAEGTLDRKALAAIVFANQEAREALNALIHPRVRELALEKFARLNARGEPLVCYEVPLLVESGLAEALRPLVVVSAPEQVQLERAAARDQASLEQIRARISAQLPLAAKARVADHVIDNSGELDQTFARADTVLDAICRTLEIDPARYPRPHPDAEA